MEREVVVGFALKEEDEVENENTIFKMSLELCRNYNLTLNYYPKIWVRGS